MGAPGSRSRLSIDRKPLFGNPRDGLLDACRAGDQRAWEAIVDRYGRLVYSIARRYRLGETDADDVLQAVFLILFRRLETIRDEAALPSWLITTTHRECWRIGRRAGREPRSLVGDVPEDEPDAADAAAWERQHLVRVGLERLGGKCQALLTALFLDRQPAYDRIAERLGIKVGSIGPTRARCFRKLERILAELGIDAGEAPPET